jgi:hypothetical protein
MSGERETKMRKRRQRDRDRDRDQGREEKVKVEEGDIGQERIEGSRLDQRDTKTSRKWTGGKNGWGEEKGQS